MPGIVGYISKQGTNEQLLDSMMQPMLHRDDYATRTCQDGNFGIGTIDLKENIQNGIAVSENGRYHLTYFGFIYEDDFEPYTDCSLRLLQRWLARGWKGLSDLNGEYLIVVRDKKEQSLTIVNDRLGMKRLNLWQGRNVLAFSSEVKSLAVIEEVDRRIDEEALSELLTFGHMQENRTLLKSVRLLRPATCLVWKEGVITQETYWKYAYKADPLLADEQLAVQTYSERIKRAIQRRVRNRNKISVLLSGGLDSRTLAGFTRGLRPNDEIESLTLGHGHDHDTKYAAQIAKALNLKHRSVKVPENFLETCGPEYAWLLDGMVSTHGCHRSVASPYLKETDIALIGFLGDAISGGMPLDAAMGITKLEVLVQLGYGQFPTVLDEAQLEMLLKPAVYKESIGKAFKTYVDTLLDADVDHLADRVAVAELEHRQRLWNPISQNELMSADCYVASPFTDKDFLDFCLSLPIEQRYRKKAYLSVLCQQLPKLARIAKSGEGIPFKCSRIRSGLHWRWVKFKREVLPKLTCGLYRHHAYLAFVHCDEWFRKSTRAFIEKNLIQNQSLSDFLNEDVLTGMVKDYLCGKPDRISMDGIAALMSVSLFHKKLTALPSVKLEGRDVKAGLGHRVSEVVK